MTNRRLIDEPRAIWDFIHSGRAVFTLVSTATGNRYTYKVSRSGSGEVWFVSLRSGADDECWSYMGVIFQDHQRRPDRFVVTRRSSVSHDATSMKAWVWFYNRLRVAHANADNHCGKALTKVEFWHEGLCGRCGRQLTVPESIELGYGPTCAEIIASRG